ncbi:hypothetical protein O9H85_06820 [Paenibacillus filicis]|uniref:Uncharacterized protein n=1 Tax=Paenibacillus gyeongsangnamensis TaxID=3388067 RepID=A0ABT4Q5H9_9BACL|nr:hypothetical protein [Paenibacillus filicis]MCZ8512142.1 hypothetical protein [Paenibacillus filicis]
MRSSEGFPGIGFYPELGGNEIVKEATKRYNKKDGVIILKDGVK